MASEYEDNNGSVNHYDHLPEPADREWDEEEWDRLLSLARASKYEQIVDDIKKRPLEQAMWFVGLVDRHLGSIKRSNLISQIEKQAISE